MLKADRKSQAADLAMVTFHSPASRQRFLEIVNTEVEASVAAREAGTTRGEIIVEVPIPAKAYAKLKVLVSDYKADGKKISISDFVARLVMAHLHKQVR